MDPLQDSELSALLADYKLALELSEHWFVERRNQPVSPVDKQLLKALKDYRHFLQRNCSVLSINPGLFRQQAANWYTKTAVGEAAAALQSQGSPPRAPWLQQLLTPELDPDGALQWSLHVSSAAVAVACCPRRALIAVATGRNLLLLHAETGQQQQAAMVHPRHLTSLSWSPVHDRILTASIDGNLHLWDASTCQLLQRTDSHGDAVAALEWSPDGSKIIVGRDNGAVEISTISHRSCSAANWPIDMTLKAGVTPVTSISWSATGDLIAAGDTEGRLRVWRYATDHRPLWEVAHSGAIRSVAWSPYSDRIAVGGADGTVSIRAASDGKPLQTLVGHGFGIRCVCWSPDATQLASGGHDETIRIWSAIDGTQQNILDGHSLTVRGLQWVRGEQQSTTEPVAGRMNATGQIFSCGDDGLICSWIPDGGRPARPSAAHTQAVTSLSWNHSGDELVSGSDDRTVAIWSATDGTLLRRIEAHTEWVTAVCCSPVSDRIASGGHDKALRIAAAVGDLSVKTYLHRAGILSARWSPDGQRILCGCADGAVRILSLDGEWPAEDAARHDRGVLSVDWSPTGEDFVSSSWDHSVQIRRWIAGKWHSQTLRGHTDAVRCVAWSPRGDHIASCGSDRTIRIWSATDGRELKSLGIHGRTVHCLAWSFEGRLLVSGGDDCRLRVSDAAKGYEEVANFPADASVQCVATSSSSKRPLRIAAGLSTGRILWLVLRESEW